VLLRDGVRDVDEATLLIRKAGLHERMEPPEEFLRRMNQLSMEMTASPVVPAAKGAQSGCSRAMKNLVGIVRAHARRHPRICSTNMEQRVSTRSTFSQSVPSRLQPQPGREEGVQLEFAPELIAQPAGPQVRGWLLLSTLHGLA